MTFSPVSRFVLIAASCIIVIIGVQAASSILAPFFLAAVFAMLCAPPLLWLQQKGVPKLFALLIIILALITVGMALVRIISTSVADMVEALPVYEARLDEQEAALIEMVSDMGVDVSGMVITDFFSAQLIAQTAGNILAGLGGALTSSFLILFTVLFMLLEASGFPTKLRAAIGASDVSMAQFDKLSRGLKNYLVIKTWMSLATGIGVAVWLTILNIDFAIFWGLVAFMFNYIPNIGSIIAAIPAVLLGFIQFGVEAALYVTVGYLLMNNIMSYVIEPRFMGRGLDLSTLVVFLSLIFWGWILGPVGLLLSPLLTALVKIALESSEDTRWIAILLGSESSAETVLHMQQEALEPPEPEPEPPAPEISRSPDASV